jgi:hypothetical protein
MARDYRIVKQHAIGCQAIKAVIDGRWRSPWWMPGKVINADANGVLRKRSYRQWLVAECNSINCDAWMIVSAESVLRVLPAA